MELYKNNKKNKFWRIFILFLISISFTLFLSWIIYFFTKENNYKNYNVNNNFISNVYVDSNFSTDTKSYIYAIETGANYSNNYKILDYKGQEFLNLFDPDFRFFHPYYYNNQLNFTWFKYDETNNIINFYKGSTIYDYYKFVNGNLDSFAYYYPEVNASISHEYYYDPYNNFIFLLDNTNTVLGQNTADNGGLGLPAIQKIVEINCNTNQSKVIDISELLNYNSGDWYYIDEQSNYRRTLMPTNDIFHFNSLDFDGQNIYANSRNLGTIFSIKVIDSNGNFLENPEINWIYSGNFASYYYYYSSDIDGDYPLIYDQNEEKYISNQNYDAQEIFDYKKDNGGLQNKFINWEINDNYYSSSNLAELINGQNYYQEELFMGEHTVKFLNYYIENLGPENFFTDPNFYDPNNLYFSIFDNHAEANDTALEIHEESINDYYTFNNSDFSYIKILEINPNQITSKTGLEPMTGRVILNHKTQQKSDIISSALFFNENNKNYIAVDQGYGGNSSDNLQSRFTIYQFDLIDPLTEDFNNFEIVYDVNFNSDYIYRSYPLWKNLNDVTVQWF